MADDRRWVQRLIDEERGPALWILAAAAIGLVFANAVGASTLSSVVDFGPAGMPLRRLASDGLLVIFFFVAGLELRHELTVGSLSSARNAAVPVLAAAAGMAVPAAIFSMLDPSRASTAWGLPIATDLPLALALLAIAGRAMPDGVRAFILTLAIVDDALSIIVIAFAFGTAISVGWMVVTLALIAVYARAQQVSGVLAFIIACCAWGAMLQTGIHPTVLGVALGLATSRGTEDVRNRWQWASARIAVPLFVATALAIPVQASGFDGRMTIALTTARVVGKPLGIALGASLAIRLFRPTTALPLGMYARAGAVASAGFSVSLLFTDLAIPEGGRTPAVVAILIALTASVSVGAMALRWPPRTR